ncbi:MAG: acyltransferase family protein [Deltaproteobacteria bacterium]|nr:acyltransferase family protein [Deltaproteobacteria bacterium]MCW5805232.1 acyltransferase family protein [Deltaproteobacteria bacterium]
MTAMASQIFERIAQHAPFHDEGHGFDVFGLEPHRLARTVEATAAVYERYFRVASTGAHHIPATGPAIVVANHGGALPVDAAMLCVDILRRSDPPRIPRAIADHFVPRLPLVSTLFARLGVVSGTRANVRRLLERGELIALWPEGVMGPGKPYRDRYRLAGWRVGFAELAIRYGAAVVPAAIVGAEESWPVVAKVSRARAFGAPFLPIPATPIPLPTRYHIHYGAPLRLGGDADDPDVVAAAAGEAQRELERLLAEALAARRSVFR